MTRSLTGGLERDLVAALIGQIDAALAGVTLAECTLSGRLPGDQARTDMADVEHRGDARRAEVVRILSGSLTVPIDREDLFRLSRSIDDVLDNLRDLVREHDLFGLPGDPLPADVLDAVRVGVTTLRSAVGLLRVDPHAVPLAALEAKKNEIRPRYQEAMAQLLSAELTGDVLKRRELLRRIDVVGLRLGEAADALADGAIKRSH